MTAHCSKKPLQFKEIHIKVSKKVLILVCLASNKRFHSLFIEHETKDELECRIQNKQALS